MDGCHSRKIIQQRQRPESRQPSLTSASYTKTYPKVPLCSLRRSCAATLGVYSVLSLIQSIPISLSAKEFPLGSVRVMTELHRCVYVCVVVFQGASLHQRLLQQLLVAGCLSDAAAAADTHLHHHASQGVHEPAAAEQGSGGYQAQSAPALLLCSNTHHTHHTHHTPHYILYNLHSSHSMSLAWF